MEGSLRSGGVVKKKTSSGCLIIKKKGENDYLGRLGVLSDNSINEENRPRLLRSDSGFSEESSEFTRRKLTDKKFHNGSVANVKHGVESEEYYRNVDEMKRSRPDVFELDEHDKFDGKRMRNKFVNDRFKLIEGSSSENVKKFGGGILSKNVVVDECKHGSYLNDPSSGRDDGANYTGGRSQGVQLADGESSSSSSMLRLKYDEVAGEQIRVQGKNGVLKVRVNTKMNFPAQYKIYDHQKVEEKKVSSRSDNVKKNVLTPVSSHSDKMLPEKHSLFFDMEKIGTKKKMELKLEKLNPFPDKNSRAKDREVDDTDTSLKLASQGLQACSTKKGVKNEEERLPTLEDVTPEGKEIKIKRGGSTEKQVLREKIRGMLVDAGWTIDYRPRRNRDYVDVVYINPSGSAYWSILKAYDALKKQLEEDNGKSKSCGGSSSFAPLSDDLLHKLTRQTKKKIAEEMKMKESNDGRSKSAKKSDVKEAAESSDSDQNDGRLSN